MKKICIIALAQHGKDTVAEILRDKYGATFSSSSVAAFNIFIFEIFKEKYGYKTVEEAFEKRHGHREELFQLISDYNTPDKSRLAREILKTNDMYVGMRCKDELNTCKQAGVFDIVVWVDALDRKGQTEFGNSITVSKEDADIVIDNNGTLEDLEKAVAELWKLVK